MNRRNFITVTASAGAAGLGAAATGRSIYELRYFHLRNGRQVERTSEFLGKHFLPAAQRLHIGALGFFNAIIGEQSPFVLIFLSYPSLEAFGKAHDAMASDREFQKGFEEFNSMTELSYMRMENSLLRAFSGMPAPRIPENPDRRPPRIFELRTYESNNAEAARRKVNMFDEGEIGIFERLGMRPVFFGETIVGENLPNLTYMLSFDDLGAREKLWKAFGGDPEWQKMRARPELADALIVSNISNSILRPLPFSPIR